MNKHPKYDFITTKVAKGFHPESEGLWLQMKTILDKEMPQKSGNRRFIIWYAIIMGVLVTSGFSIYLFKASHKAHADNFINVKFTDRTKTLGLDQTKTATNNKETSTGNVKTSTGTSINLTADHDKQTSLTPRKADLLTHDQPVSEQQTIAITERDKDIIALIVESRLKNQRPVKSKVDQNNWKRNAKTIVSTLSVPLIKSEISTSNYTSNQTITTARELPVQNRNVYQTIQPVRTVDPILYLPNSKTLATGNNSPVLMQDGSLKGAEITSPLDSAVAQRSRPGRIQFNKIVAGISVNASLPLSSQEMSNISPSGNESRLFDFLPSVHLQYHLNRKLYLATEFQFVTPQYTPQLTLFDKRIDINSYKFNRNSISLNKLYYLNIPVSIHYSPVKNVYIGGGIQYAALTRSVMTEEEATWQKSGGEWKQTSSKKNTKVKSNPSQERKNHNANNGQGQGQPGMPEMPTDSIAGSFRNSDWRFLVDASYQYRKFSAGFRFNMGLNNYVNLEVTNGTGTTSVKDRNKSFMLYLRYNIFDKRK